MLIGSGSTIREKRGNAKLTRKTSRIFDKLPSVLCGERPPGPQHPSHWRGAGGQTGPRPFTPDPSLSFVGTPSPNLELATVASLPTLPRDQAELQRQRLCI